MQVPECFQDTVRLLFSLGYTRLSPKLQSTRWGICNPMTQETEAAGSVRCDGLHLLFQHFRDGGSLGMRTHLKNSVGFGQMAQWLPCWSSRAPSSQHPFQQIKIPLLPSRGICMFKFCFKLGTNGENHYDGSHINPEIRNKYDSVSSG